MSNHRLYQEILPKKASKLQIREAIETDINLIVNGILSIRDKLEDTRTPLANDLDDSMKIMRDVMIDVMKQIE